MFKSCPNCHQEWASRSCFLCDPGLELIGYQANFKAVKAGIFLFNHTCRGTLAIPAEAFIDLYNGPMFKERLNGHAQCPEHCLHEADLDPCPLQCECSFVRQVLQIVREWPKTRLTATAAK
jgi:hypothetical protein